MVDGRQTDPNKKGEESGNEAKMCASGRVGSCARNRPSRANKEEYVARW